MKVDQGPNWGCSAKEKENDQGELKRTFGEVIRV
jgi:hypothetical protein